MKYSPFFYLTMLLLSCNSLISNKKQETQKEPVIHATDLAADSNDEPSSSEEIEAAEELPAGMMKTERNSFDSLLNFEVNITYAYPVDGSQAAYLQLLHTTIDPLLKDYEKKVRQFHQEDGDDNELAGETPYLFSATPLSYYQDSTLVSIRYIITTYGEGAAHTIAGLASINYDKVNDKQIRASDYFNFKTPADSALIVNILNEELGDLKALSSDIPWVFYGLDHLDFNIKKDMICFNFSDYALGQGPSTIVYKVSKARLKSLIQSAYK